MEEKTFRRDLQNLALAAISRGLTPKFVSDEMKRAGELLVDMDPNAQQPPSRDR